MNQQLLLTNHFAFEKKITNTDAIIGMRKGSILLFLSIFCFFQQLQANTLDKEISQKVQSETTPTKKYQVFDNWLTWNDAKAYCESLGGHLASITSKEELDYVLSILEEHPSMQYYWLGGSDESEEGTWKWVTGEKWEYTNWYTGEPNHYYSDEDYLQLFNYCINTRGTWNDATPTASNFSSSKFGFICEWDIAGIYNISPKIGYNNAEFTDITVYSYPLASGSSIELVNEENTIKADSILEINSYNIKARFSLKNEKIGLYDAILISPNDTLRLEKSFSLIYVSDAIEPTDTDNNGLRNISFFGHIVWISQHIESWSCNYELDNDIDASETEYWNDGKGLNPITEFSGTIDGQGHKIRFLHINRTDQDYVALLGKLNSKGVIRNMGLTSCNIKGKNYTASLVGSNNGGSISNCYSSGSISGNENIGGLVGYNSGIIKFCYNSAFISGLKSIGGLAGNSNNSSNIFRSYNLGKVVGSNENVGGIIGENNGSISDCYNSALIIGAGDVGGISGRNFRTISNTYNRGIINGTGNYCGAINGYNNGSITNSFWDKENRGLTTSNGGTGKTATEMKTQSTYTNWDFSTVWEIISTMNDGYPEFKWSNNPNRIKSYTPDRTANVDSCLITFEGSGFNDSTKVFLSKTGQTIIKADTLNYNDSYCAARFNLKKAALGTWNISVQYPDTTITIQNGLTVEELQELNLLVNILGPDKVRTNRSGSFIVEYKNTSNVFVQNVPIWIAVNKNSDVKFKFPILIPNDSNIVDLYPYIEIENLKGNKGPFKCYCFNIPYINAYGTGQLELDVKSITSINSESIQLFSWIGQPKTYKDNKNLKTKTMLKSETSDNSTCDLLDFCSKIAEYVKLTDQQNCICGEVQGIFKTIPNLIVSLAYQDRLDPNYQNEWKTLYDNGDISEEYYRQQTKLPALENPYHILQKSLDHCIGSTLSKSVVDAIKKTDGSNYANWPDCLKDPAQHKSIIVSSYDPNDKIGYRSPSGSKYFNNDNSNFTYEINFENKQTATAAAQEVVVSDTLDLNLFNVESFRAGSIKIGQNTYPASYNVQENKWLIDMRPSKNLITNVTLTLDKVKGIATWYFRSVDPVTMDWPQDVTLGFLPPNDSIGSGQGSVSFTIDLKTGLASDVSVKNKATIVFDTNAPIITPTWENTKDIIAPVSNMKQPEVVNDSIITLKWLGEDNRNGSGVYQYNVYVKKAGDTYAALLTNTSQNSIDFKFIKETQYNFYVTAKDSAGNEEIKTNVPDITFKANSFNVTISRKWDDVLVCNNVEKLFSSYQWYKNDIAITGETKQYYQEIGGLNGSYYVKVITTDGKSGISNTINAITSAKSIKAYPNPTADNQSFRLEIKATETDLKQAKLTISTLSGQVVLQDSNLQTQMLLNGLPKGCYIIHVRLTNGEQLNEKLMIN